MSDLTFDAILADCGLTLMDLLGMSEKDPSESFVQVHTFLVALREDVRKEEEKKEGEKQEPPYVKAWQKDNKAKARATEIALSIVADLAKYEGNAALMFHLRNAVRESVVKYLATEVDYAEWQAERKMPTVNVAKNTRAVNADRYKVGKEGLTNIFNLKGHEMKLPADILASDGKRIVPKLPAMPGNFGGSGAASSGRYAVLYRLTYKVNGKAFTDPREALRAIWQGADRVGKNTADLFDAVEKMAPKAKEDNEPHAFNLNGANVIVQRIKQ